jgi:integrase
LRDLDDGGRIFVVSESKTEAGVRRVGVPEVLRPLLLSLAKDKAPTAPLFPGLTKDGLRWWVESLCKEAGVPRVTPHGLRGTNATAALTVNANPLTVAAALGHANIGVTLRHYADGVAVAEAKQSAAVETLLPSKTRSKNQSKTFGRGRQKQESPARGLG